MRGVFLISLPLLLSLGACLDRGEYPSLRPRAFEVAAGDAALPPPPVPERPAAAEVIARSAALLTRGQAGQRAFEAELAAARPVIARAGAADSESWITAQEQVSALDASRGETVVALADLDAFTRSGVDASGVRFSEADLAVLRDAGGRLGAMVDAQQRELAALAASIAAP